MASKNSVHLATLVTNIKNCIPITLNEDAHQYNTWSTIFHLHCRAHLLLDHIVFDDKNPSSTNVSWQRFDDIMRTWIYVNIFVELIKSILSPTDKAIDTWNRLVNRFQNHKTTRVLTLESQFNSIHLSRFFLSSLLQVLPGLTEDYSSFRSIVQHINPHPDFDAISSMIELEEQTHNREVPLNDTALLVSDSLPATSSLTESHQSSHSGSRGRRNNRRGGKGSRQSSSGHSSQHSQTGRYSNFGPRHSNALSNNFPQWAYPP
ncbi:uncharacterized protein LOC130821768 [Amaranthus tricolor]|uniref:uncharacterized protein LOC130821768 n=1 Tax=Amaranthus tricolor TaxID=29722 RepID=UPI00258958B9|nr:uncharacterized protein LOC130821768 [Amaranthus tricolor]